MCITLTWSWWLITIPQTFCIENFPEINTPSFQIKDPWEQKNANSPKGNVERKNMRKPRTAELDQNSFREEIRHRNKIFQILEISHLSVILIILILLLSNHSNRNNRCIQPLVSDSRQNLFSEFLTSVVQSFSPY